MEKFQKFGIAEDEMMFGNALKTIGKQDQEGNTLAVIRFSYTALQAIPLMIRLGVLLLLILSIFFQHPLAWIPLLSRIPIEEIQNWEVFSLAQWASAVALFAVYVCFTFVKNNIFTGQPGAEIHFVRHQQIVQTVKEGQRAVILDPRVRPFAIVSTKPITVIMEPVESTTRDNMSIIFSGALIIRVNNSFKLLAQGGFQRFLEQIDDLYQSLMKDAGQNTDAREFSQFFVDPADVSKSFDNKDSITKRLTRLEGSQLSIKLLQDLSEIDEVNVSTFDLTESAEPLRKSIITKLQPLAESYGIEVLDHIPAGNRANENYLRSLAFPLVSSTTRLAQATTALGDITNQEIQQEIEMSVSGKRLGKFEIERLMAQIKASIQVLDDPDTLAATVLAKQNAIRNVADGLLASAIARIETLVERMRGMRTNAAGIERYLQESDQVLAEIAENLGTLVPTVTNVVTHTLSKETLLPEIDFVEQYFQRTGTRDALNALRVNVKIGEGEDTDMKQGLEEQLVEIESQVSAIEVDAIVQQIQEALVKFSYVTGISTEAHSPDNVRQMLENIAERAHITDPVVETKQAA